ncbi:hypothetical protein Purlil1_11893 [Purpureocillium lilacinum]|uniref:Cyclohexanone monooxygenase n=1 Tax=Purpureocillium lilacinum TaxID=33203 RepID=A0ABR0BJ56_PURLI|nr:hypothetical protein Purlil1_11893 [Purpureocillium lilacinum]
MKDPQTKYEALEPSCISVDCRIMAAATSEDVLDVLIIGAGLSGICSLYHVKHRFSSWRVLALESGSDVGGTWYWNRYPGCRFDSESVSYCFSFDKELLAEWHWKETFSSQPETYKYIRHFARKHGLYDYIRFNITVKAAQWNDEARHWIVTDETGNQLRTRFLVSCLGFLSSPTLPAIPGIDRFQGQYFHTSRWPASLNVDHDFADRRIGIIGTGATGIQTTTALSKVPNILSLTVFQRTANWAAPLWNTEISEDQMVRYREQYGDIFKRCSETWSCFLHDADPRKSVEVSQEERIALWERVYHEPGFSKWLGVFSDTYTDREANALYTTWMEGKIRDRVQDPTVANSLIPDHGFGLRRVPLESGYFEAFNKPHVHLVDLKSRPIREISTHGIITSDGALHEIDVLICATGFNAITGAFSAIEWECRGGRPLTRRAGTDINQEEVWADDRPKTYLGIAAPSTPNMLMVLGPHQPYGNATRSIEHVVEVICDMLEYCKDNHYTYFEATEEAARDWTNHVIDAGSRGLLNEVDSWMTGVNRNVEGKTVRNIARYAGSATEFRRRCEESKAENYKGFRFV